MTSGPHAGNGEESIHARKLVQTGIGTAAPASGAGMTNVRAGSLAGLAMGTNAAGGTNGGAAGATAGPASSESRGRELAAGAAKLFQEGQYRAAMARYAEAVRMQPSRAEYHFGLGATALRADQRGSSSRTCSRPPA